MAKIGDVEFNVLTESRPRTNTVTTYPVEDGADMTDHIERDRRSIEITGVVGDDDDPAKTHEELTIIWYHGKVVDYKGRSTLRNCVIEDFTVDVSSESVKGFTFSMTLTQIEVAKPSTVGLLPTNLKVDMKEIGNAGRVQAS